MTYRLRAGWIDALVGAGPNGALRSRYHASADCARIHESDTLRRVDKPHGAPGCPACTTQDGACDASREPVVSESAVTPEALVGQAQGILMALNPVRRGRRLDRAAAGLELFWYQPAGVG